MSSASKQSAVLWVIERLKFKSMVISDQFATDH